MTGRVTSTSFVGREEELSRLQLGLQSAATGKPGTLLIAGEAGVGKTRLVHEFAERIRGEAQVLLGSCIPLSGGGLPYGPTVDALRPLTRDLDPAELKELLGPTFDDLTRLLPGTTMRPRRSLKCVPTLPRPEREEADGDSAASSRRFKTGRLKVIVPWPVTSSCGLTK